MKMEFQKVLSEQEINMIHTASLEVSENTGALICSEKLLRLYTAMPLPFSTYVRAILSISII